MADNIELKKIAENDPTVQPLVDLIEMIMGLPDDSLNETTRESIKGMITGAITPTLQKQMKENVLQSFRNNNYSRGEAKNNYDNLVQLFNSIIDDLQPSNEKRDLLQSIFSIMGNSIKEAVDSYLTHDIVLPMTIEEGAHEPSYAHDTDAAADLYAKEDFVVPAHSLGNKIGTGVRIALPDGWVAHIAPRSSIGAKTPLRLSNNLGIIDAHYRGELIVLFDNISNFDYTIKAGDRIAQLWVTPSYRFKANVVQSLDETDRGEGGLGSTGQ